MDIFTKEKRSWVMSRVKSRDTKPELLVRKAIRKMGIHFQTCSDHLPGKPDIVLGQRKKLIFIHGCFWHHHKGCSKSTFPQTNSQWWKLKILKNVKRDRQAIRDLSKQAWQTLVLWECCLKDREKLNQSLRIFLTNKTDTRHQEHFN